MYLKRKIDAFLMEWRRSGNRLPLIIRGARQVGKTEAIRHFAEQAYSHLVEVNFVEEPRFKSIIEEGYKPETIVKLMSKMDLSFRFEPGKTLIFFD